VLAACSPVVAAQARMLEEAYARLLSDAIPDWLRIGPFRVLQNDGSSALVDSYRDFDPLSVSRRLLHVLPEFDGRAVQEVLEELPRRHGVQLSPGLVRKLVDFGVLIPGDEPASA